MQLFDVIVVGGGLSGVMVGHELQKLSTTTKTNDPIDWKLLEARRTLGGRLANNQNQDGSDGKIDMGGAWIWPFQQPFMKSLVRELKLPTFTQPDEASSTRFDGGAVDIVRSLSDSMASHEGKNDESTRFELNTPVTSCTLVNDPKAEKLVRLDTLNNQSYLARRVVFAVPPRVLHKHVTFQPPLSPRKQAALASSHTWMAGVTKVALVYPKRFWDLGYSNMGLPQQYGPAFQVYDSSTANQDVSALTFFALVKPDNAAALKDDSVLAKQVADQMAKVWDYLRQPESAKKAHSYTSHHVHRWPLETYISEDETPVQIHPHPHPVAALSEPEWSGLLEFAGSETDRQSPGVMEGAVGAARRVLQSLGPFLSGLSSSRPREAAEQCAASPTK